MKSRTFRKIAALVIVLTMVLSVAGVALASHSENHTHVLYYNNGGSENYYAYADRSVPDSGTSQSVTFNLGSAPTRSGYAFTGFNIYQEGGSLLASNVAAESSKTVTITRSKTWSDWPYIYVVGQWNRTYVGSTLDHIDVRVPASVTIAGVTYPAAVQSVSGTFNGSARSFVLSSGEYRNYTDFTHQASNIVVFNVALRVNLGGGEYLDTSATLTFTGADLDVAIANCPASGRDKGYDFNISTEVLSEAITVEASYYTLTYQITSDIVGQPAAPATYAGYVEPTLTDATPFDGYNFFGWSPATIVWTPAGAAVVMIEDEPTLVAYYEATVTGEYSQMRIVPADTQRFSLLYRGFVDGAIFWPADVLNQATAPTADGTPYLAEHDFLGWTPGALDWAGATVSYIYEVQVPEQGGTPYMLQIPVYTLTVFASFDQEIPTEPEIPTGIPATGDANWLVFAGIILLAGAALGGYTLVRRKDS